MGFTYVTVDMEGYRSGSMDEALPGKGKEGNGGQT
jgi:PP-loop superfamily ATP-utilizing enzyme